MEMPAISIILPMYNVEKYIGECLDSILNQTFQNFEVIVVDDCSTDNSAAIVKNYAPRFGGRLRLERTLENSGGCAMPRNKGMVLSRGEYLIFLDADDTITSTALEELYSAAKHFDADVIACERFYQIPGELWHNAMFRRQVQPFTWRTGSFVDRPTFLPDNILERLNLCNQRMFLWVIWAKLIRRDLILKNEFKFPNTIVDDLVFTICLLCTAEKFVVVPNVVNYYRMREASLTYNEKRDDEKFFRKYVKAFAVAFRYFDKFLSDREKFRNNSYMKYIIFEICWSELLMGYFFPLYEKAAVYELDKVLMEELSADDNVALAAFTFNMGIVQRLQLDKAQKRIAELENELQRRR